MSTRALGGAGFGQRNVCGGAVAYGPADSFGSRDSAMRFMMMFVAWFLAALPALTPPAAATEAADGGGAAVHAAYMDKAGVGRLRASNEPVALYGAHYCIMSRFAY